MPITADFIDAQGALLQEFQHTRQRAAELADEMTLLRAHAAEMSRVLTVADEPADHRAALRPGFPVAGRDRS